MGKRPLGIQIALYPWKTASTVVEPFSKRLVAGEVLLKSRKVCGYLFVLRQNILERRAAFRIDLRIAQRDLRNSAHK